MLQDLLFFAIKFIEEEFKSCEKITHHMVSNYLNFELQAAFINMGKLSKNLQLGKTITK